LASCGSLEIKKEHLQAETVASPDLKLVNGTRKTLFLANISSGAEERKGK